MTFDQVIVFHKIIQLGSFKSAADALFKTQPAISLAIKKLEEEMEVELFDRSGYRPFLTPHGRAFYERSLLVLQGMTELEQLSQSFRNKEEPEIIVSVDGISPLPELLNLFKNFKEKFTHTKLNLSIDILSESERRVLERNAQIGITHFLSDKNSLEVFPMGKVRMVPVMSWELFQEKKVSSQNDLFQIDQVVIGDKNGPKGASFGLLDNGKKWRILDGSFKREIIMAGLAWGHLAQHTITRELHEGKLVVLDFEDIYPKDITIHLIRHKKHQFGIVARSLWDELISLSQKNERS
jgi:DNA-binding transcriptional LysR family regulator